MDKPQERRNLILVSSAIGLITEATLKAIDHKPAENEDGVDPLRQQVADAAAATIDSAITTQIGGK